MRKTFLQIKWVLSQGKPILFWIILLIILKSFFSTLGVASALVSKYLIDAATLGESSLVFKWISIMAIIIIINLSSGVILSMISAYSSTKLTNIMQKNIFTHITYSEWLESSKYHSVNLISRMSSDVATINGILIGTLPKIFSLCTTLLSSFIALFYLQPKLAILAIVIFPLFILISLVLSKLIKKLYIEMQELQIKYKTFIQESIQNMLIVKTFCHEENNINKIEDLQNHRMNLTLKSTLYGSFASLFLKIGSAFGYFTVFFWGAMNLSKGIGTFGTLTALLQLFNNIQKPLKSLVSCFPNLITSLAAAERLMEIEALALEEKKILLEKKQCESLPIPRIELNNINFSYKSNKTILKNINLNIKPGEIVALVGPSGEGKTTLIKIILKLIKAKEGSLSFTINNKPLDEKFNLRSIISYVPQGNTLFSGTIEENLNYGDINNKNYDIINSLKMACALDFVNSFPKGLKTPITEKGGGISEGQAQRLCLARAFIRKRPILILDEATSALDEITELKILNEIKNLTHKPTCIIITHRPSTLKICNRILELKQGVLNDITKKKLKEIHNEKLTYGA
ncbi:ABC transporter ATP-binding protein [Clostridium tarantellae]|uniref:ATP-binding cassette domain-containing protein n=1 Tax=Clostridium tarantellae TaxID=39493 RepID=A0A6I1MKB2_9CLOT|nr:ABC transporter ATP-binding protein [Clostridium tarantellae]MPQ42612.1 ATP-binding cassette domain-containing protein [Clostridium tarantellae]